MPDDQRDPSAEINETAGAGAPAPSADEAASAGALASADAPAPPARADTSVGAASAAHAVPPSAASAASGSVPSAANPAHPAAVSAAPQPAPPLDSAPRIHGDVIPVPDYTTTQFEPPALGENAVNAGSGIELLDDVELDVRIELGRTEMYVEDVLKLGVGSVVSLDKLAGDPVDVYVNEQLVARGEVLVLNENFCVRINDIVSPVPEREAAK
ncbi:Flagellar motor switch protein FliN [Phycisphaerae bacterium RAS1]|nr:Flagellar motor switch protein FliN [Phycisphaerae bacterium RAS1]